FWASAPAGDEATSISATNIANRFIGASAFRPDPALRHPRVRAGPDATRGPRDRQYPFDAADCARLPGGTPASHAHRFDEGLMTPVAVRSLLLLALAIAA